MLQLGGFWLVEPGADENTTLCSGTELLQKENPLPNQKKHGVHENRAFAVGTLDEKAKGCQW